MQHASTTCWRYTSKPNEHPIYVPVYQDIVFHEILCNKSSAKDITEIMKYTPQQRHFLADTPEPKQHLYISSSYLTWIFMEFRALALAITEIQKIAAYKGYMMSDNQIKLISTNLCQPLIESEIWLNSVY